MSMRAGIIGCGGIAGVHARSIVCTEGSSLCAVADCVPQKAETLAAQYSARAYADWEEMLKREALDIVHICTPHYLHTPMAAACIGRGIHVFTEKPPVISREQLELLRELARPSGVRLGVCFQNRWNPEVQAAKALLESGELGGIVGARGFVTWRRDGAYYGDDWHGKLALEGGGALINQGIHTLDLMQYLIGKKADAVEAMQGNFHLQGEMEVEDTLCAHMFYPGVRAVFYVTTGYAQDVSPLVELVCEKGSLRMEDSALDIRRHGQPPERRTFTQAEGYGKAYWGAGHQTAVSHFYGSVAEGVPDLLDFSGVEDTLELMLDIYAKARGGETC